MNPRLCRPQPVTLLTKLSLLLFCIMYEINESAEDTDHQQAVGNAFAIIPAIPSSLPSCSTTCRTCTLLLMVFTHVKFASPYTTSVSQYWLSVSCPFIPSPFFYFIGNSVPQKFSCKMDFLVLQKINFHYQDNRIECVVYDKTLVDETYNSVMARFRCAWEPHTPQSQFWLLRLLL